MASEYLTRVTAANTVAGTPTSFSRTVHTPFPLVQNALATANSSGRRDPYSLLYDATRRAADVPYEFELPRSGLLMELNVLWSSTDAADALTTDPEIRVFGSAPIDEKGPRSFAQPTRLLDPGAALAAPFDREYWFPLQTVSSSPATLVTFTTADAWDYVTGGTPVYWHMTAPVQVHLAGAYSVCATLVTAAAITGGAGTRACYVMGRVIDA